MKNTTDNLSFIDGRMTFPIDNQAIQDNQLIRHEYHHALLDKEKQGIHVKP